MDSRYFHGIRTMAADVLAQSAKKSLDWIGLFHLKKSFQELFCLPNSPMTRSNDFSDRSLYLIQCAIPRAIARIKGENGKPPMEARRFLLDLMRYNDNRGNDYSDDYYISTLMRCLAECLVSISTAVVLPWFNIEERTEEFDFTKKAIEELTRHQRLDEWIPTFQNIYTTTGLDCTLKLVMNRIMPFNPSEFSQYAQLGNADNVRLKAWECLIRLGMIRKDSVLRFLMHEIRSDPSPYFRTQLLLIFDIAVGQIATGDVFAPSKPQEATRGLVIDQEADGSARASNLARQSLAGALNGLKQDLVNNQTLRSVLEEALKSRTLSLSDMTHLLDFCDMIFRDRRKSTLPVKLRYPHYWKVKHLGQGKLQFTQTDKVRTKALRPLTKQVPPTPTTVHAPASAPVPVPVPAPAPQPAPAQAQAAAVLAPPALPVAAQPLPTPIVPSSTAPPKVAPSSKPKLSLKFGKSSTSATASSPPPSALYRTQPTFSPPIKHASPAPMSAPPSRKASPAPQPAVMKQEAPALPSRPSSPPAVSPPKKDPTPAPVVKAPTPLPAAPTTSTPAGSATPAPRPKPAPVNVAKVISAPSPIHSPIPSSGPKIKIKTKTVPGSSAPNSRPSTPAPSRPSVPPPRSNVVAAPPSRSATSTPAPRPSSVPSKQTLSKPKRSKIVKLKLSPDVLAQFKNGSSKKRKLPGGSDDRPFKRQSVEPNGLMNGAANRGLVKIEKSGGERPKLIVRMKVDRFKLPR